MIIYLRVHPKVFLKKMWLRCVTFQVLIFQVLRNVFSAIPPQKILEYNFQYCKKTFFSQIASLYLMIRSKVNSHLITDDLQIHL